MCSDLLVAGVAERWFCFAQEVRGLGVCSDSKSSHSLLFCLYCCLIFFGRNGVLCRVFRFYLS